MLRSLLRPVAAVLCLSAAAPVWAADDTPLAAPSAAVASAWVSERSEQVASTKPVNLMLVTYAALQGLDMATTVQARRAGAQETNPLMAGGMWQATAMKAGLALGAIATLKLISKKNRKATLFTALALNVASGVMVANNMRNTHHLSQ